MLLTVTHPDRWQPQPHRNKPATKPVVGQQTILAAPSLKRQLYFRIQTIQLVLRQLVLGGYDTLLRCLIPARHNSTATPSPTYNTLRLSAPHRTTAARPAWQRAPITAAPDTMTGSTTVDLSSTRTTTVEHIFSGKQKLRALAFQFLLVRLLAVTISYIHSLHRMRQWIIFRPSNTANTCTPSYNGTSKKKHDYNTRLRLSTKPTAKHSRVSRYVYDAKRNFSWQSFRAKEKSRLDLQYGMSQYRAYFAPGNVDPFGLMEGAHYRGPSQRAYMEYLREQREIARKKANARGLALAQAKLKTLSGFHSGYKYFKPTGIKDYLDKLHDEVSPRVNFRIQTEQHLAYWYGATAVYRPQTYTVHIALSVTPETVVHELTHALDHRNGRFSTVGALFYNSTAYVEVTAYGTQFMTSNNHTIFWLLRGIEDGNFDSDRVQQIWFDSWENYAKEAIGRPYDGGNFSNGDFLLFKELYGLKTSCSELAKLYSTPGCMLKCPENLPSAFK